MEQTIFEMLWQNVHVLGLGFTLAIISGWAVYRFMRFNSRFEKNEAAITDLGVRVTNVERRLDAVERRLDAVEIRLSVVEIKLDMLSDKVDKLSGKVDRLIEVMLVKNKNS